MKNILILILFVFTGIINAQKNAIVGDWLLEKIEKGNEIQSVNQIVNFNKDGTIYIQEMAFGSWHYNSKNKTLHLDMRNIKGEHQIIKNKNNKLIIKLNNDITYFIKIDKKIAIKDNAAFGLIGTWQLENKTNVSIKQFIIFKTPNTFTFIEKGDGMESTSKGTWFFNAKQKNLILTGQVGKFKGMNLLLNIDDNEFSIKKNKDLFTFKKVIQNTNNIERLTFLEEDFYDENGEFKYYDEREKLPWKSFYQRVFELEKIKQLVYKYGELIESTKSFETKILTAEVNANEAEQTLTIDYIFYGYDRYNLPEDASLYTESYDNYSSPLYPLKEDTFRVIGEEEISVPAGKFTCTVVEVLIDSNQRQKVWLINNKPGIIAKIINDKSGSFGYYNIYELNEIKH